MSANSASYRFPKSSRLLKSRDFKLFPSKRLKTESFTFVFNTQGEGRLGISISKKVLRRANARNRVRRLLREAFRYHYNNLRKVDLHVIGAPPLSGSWDRLKLQDVSQELQKLVERVA